MHQGKRIYVRGVVIITWYGTSYPVNHGDWFLIETGEFKS